MINKFIKLIILITLSISTLYAIDEPNKIIDKKNMIIKDELGNDVDLYFVDGMKYFLGEIGVSEHTKIYLVKCPYKVCKDTINENKVTSTNKDYKSAIILFRQSMEEFHNVKAANMALDFLRKQLNYKERRYAKYLVEKFPERIGEGYGYEEYVKDMNDFASFLADNNNILGNIVMGEIYFNGVLDKPINTIKAKSYFDKAIELCKIKPNFECIQFQNEYKSKFE